MECMPFLGRQSLGLFVAVGVKAKDDCYLLRRCKRVIAIFGCRSLLNYEDRPHKPENEVLDGRISLVIKGCQILEEIGCRGHRSIYSLRTKKAPLQGL